MASVLLVDDEPDFLVLMEMLLKKQGYTVSGVLDGKGALKKAVEVKPDVILLDVMMPDINGWEVARELKNNPDTKDLPIIILTAAAEKKIKLTSFDYAGAEWHISKPFDNDLLLFIIEQAVKKQKGKLMEEKIKEAIGKDKKMKKVLEMVNPKLLDYDYTFLDKQFPLRNF
jgi:CheY-like chemotaxis protein